MTKPVWTYSRTIHYVTTNGTVTCKTIKGCVAGSEKALRKYLDSKEQALRESLGNIRREIVVTGTYSQQ